MSSLIYSLLSATGAIGKNVQHTIDADSIMSGKDENVSEEQTLEKVNEDNNKAEPEQTVIFYNQFPFDNNSTHATGSVFKDIKTGNLFANRRFYKKCIFNDDSPSFETMSFYMDINTGLLVRPSDVSKKLLTDENRNEVYNFIERFNEMQLSGSWKNDSLLAPDLNAFYKNYPGIITTYCMENA